MKLIIDIPEERLNSIKRFGIKQNEVSMTEHALISGIPFDSAIKDIRPKGKWTKSDIPESVLSKCSICGWNLGAYSHKFCANCGADMRGE